MRVLIAEDDLMNQMLMGKYMCMLGWEHTIVATVYWLLKPALQRIMMLY